MPKADSIWINALCQPFGKLPWDLLQINFKEGSKSNDLTASA